MAAASPTRWRGSRSRQPRVHEIRGASGLPASMTMCGPPATVPDARWPTAFSEGEYFQNDRRAGRHWSSGFLLRLLGTGNGCGRILEFNGSAAAIRPGLGRLVIPDQGWWSRSPAAWCPISDPTRSSSNCSPAIEGALPEGRHLEIAPGVNGSRAYGGAGRPSGPSRRACEEVYDKKSLRVRWVPTGRSAAFSADAPIGAEIVFFSFSRPTKITTRRNESSGCSGWRMGSRPGSAYWELLGQEGYRTSLTPSIDPKQNHHAGR